jgi:hypothetical protein
VRRSIISHAAVENIRPRQRLVGNGRCGWELRGEIAKALPTMRATGTREAQGGEQLQYRV